MAQYDDFEEAAKYYHEGVEGLYHEGEEVIARYYNISWSYAEHKLKGRFRLGEFELKNGWNRKYWYRYVEFLRKKGIEV